MASRPNMEHLIKRKTLIIHLGSSSNNHSNSRHRRRRFKLCQLALDLEGIPRSHSRMASSRNWLLFRRKALPLSLNNNSKHLRPCSPSTPIRSVNQCLILRALSHPLLLYRGRTRTRSRDDYPRQTRNILPQMSNSRLRNHHKRSRSSLSGPEPTLLRGPHLLRSKVYPQQQPPCGLTQLVAPTLSDRASLSISRLDKVGKTLRVVQWVG